MLAGKVVAALELSHPSYKHPWCASVEATLDNTHQSEAGYEAALVSEDLPQLLNDLYAYAPPGR